MLGIPALRAAGGFVVFRQPLVEPERDVGHYRMEKGVRHFVPQVFAQARPPA